MHAYLLLLFSLLPYEAATQDHVEVIEVNQLFDEHGKHVLSQNIFRDGYTAFPIRAWRLVRHSGHAPYYDTERQTYRVDWHDGTTLRTVWAKEVRETWTQSDPELAKRAEWPAHYRRELTKPIRKEKE